MEPTSPTQDQAKARDQAFATTGRSRRGEPWVWLTAAGLAIGVTMASSAPAKALSKELLPALG
jgi:hypothetical protein